jgi:signal transduction histidine kinase
VRGLARDAARRAADSRFSARELSRIATATLAELEEDDPLAAVLVVDRRTRPLADTSRSAAARPPAVPRPELTVALNGTLAQYRRHSRDLGAEIEVTAVPIVRDAFVVGALRIRRGPASLAGHVDGPRLLLAVFIALAALMAMGVATALARPLVRQLARLEATVRRMSQGDLEARAPVVGSREQRLVARALNDMASRLQDLLRSREAFVANASHELRTPLTGMRLRLELLHRLARDDEHARRQADEALREVDRLSGIVEKLLVLSRQTDRLGEENRVVLNDVARSVTERWRATADERGISLVFRAVGDGEPLDCAPEDAERALEALVENALAYSPPGSVVEVVSGAGRVEVLDRGAGLAPGEEEEVFERFQRGSAGRSGPKGSGLGLPIARELMERWGGTARIANREGGGARAVLELPTAGAAETREDFTLA